MPPEVDEIIKTASARHVHGAYGVTEAQPHLVAAAGVQNRPNAAGVINDEYFDVRIFDDDDNELPRDTEGEIVIRPKRPHVMFEGYWGRRRPPSDVSGTGGTTPATSAGSTTTTTSSSSTARRTTSVGGGEHLVSFEVECILMGHGALADVAVHAVPSEMTEDDLKITATLSRARSLTEEDLFRWCIDQLPYFALPRYIEFRTELPRSPVGRVLKRELRDEGVTDTTWDAEASGITYEKR